MSSGINEAPKRVLYVEQNEDGTVGGSHRILADLVVRLSSAYEPVVVFYQDNPWVEKLRAAGIEVEAWDERRCEESGGRGPFGTLVNVAAQVRHRRRFLRDARIDAVHLNNAPYVGADVWIPACRVVGIPCMTYAMGYGPRESAVQRWIQRRYDLVFSLSEEVEADLDRLGIPRSRRIMAHPGIDATAELARVRRGSSDVRRELGVGEDDVLAVMVGNLREWKGQHVVIDAASRLSEDVRRRMSLILVGASGTSASDAAYVRRLRAELRDRGLEDTVSLLGARDDVPDLFAASDIAIHASVIPEPFGMVVLEAMVHGCAVIASNRGGPAEIIPPGAGHTFDVGDPEALATLLERLVLDAEERSSLGEAARERARQFDITRHVRRIEAGYRRVFGE